MKTQSPTQKTTAMKPLLFRNHTDLAKTISLLLMLAVAPGLRAASGTWNNGASNNLWQTSSNWSASPFPGATSGFASTDAATFGSTGSGTIDLGGTLNVQSISFGVNSVNAGAFTIGKATDTLNLTSGGSITVNGGVTANETIGTAGGGIINTSTTANSTYSFLNNGQGTLTVAGNVTANQATGSATILTLGGIGNGTVSGAITGGGTAGNAALKMVKNGSGTWTLGGANTYTGGTTVNGGKLVFDYTTHDPIATSTTEPLIIDNGAVTFKGKTSGTTTDTVGVLSLSYNVGTANTLTLDANGGSGVNLTVSSLSGAATPLVNSLIDLSSNAGGNITVSALGTNAANANGVLMLGSGGNSRGALFVRDTGGYGFATLSGATSGTIGRLTSGTTLDATNAGNTNNYFLTTAGTLTRTASLDYSTLTIDSSAGAVTLALGTNSIISGALGRALLVVGNNDVNITGTGSFSSSSTFIYNYGQGKLSISQGSTASAMEFGGPGLIDYAGTFVTTMGTGVGFTGGITRLSKAQDLTAVTTTHFYVGGGVLEIGADLNGATAGDFSNPIATSGNKYIQFVGDSGLSAYGANRVVNFGGAAAQITWGSGGFLTNTDGTTDGGYTFKLSSTASNASIEVKNPIALGTNTTRVVDVADGSSTTDAILSGVLSGTGASLTKTGAGTLSLTVNNSYTGMTTVSAGALSIGSGGGLASGNALTVGASGTADFANAGQNLGAVSNANTATNALNFSAATGTVTLGSLSGAGNTHFASNGTVTGGISGGTVNVAGLLTSDISGGTVGAGSLTAGTVSGGTNAITGAAGITTLSNGATTVGGVATIGTMSGGTANLNGATSAITTLNGGTVNLGGSTVLSVSNGTTSGAITGSGGSLTKTGGGTLTLSAANSYTGTTLVSSGTLLIDGNQTSATGTTTVAGGARIGGIGTIGGNLTLNANAQFVLNLAAPLVVAGTVSLDNNFSIASLVNADGSAIDWSSVAETTYTLISNSSSTFSNIQNWGYANRATGLGGGREAYFAAGSLDLHVVPEPATWALRAFSLMTVMVLRRRRAE